MSIDQRLAELGIDLPEPAAPVAAYVPAVEIGGLLHISGQISMREDGSLISRGDVPIHDLNREFGWQLPEDVAITIAGLVLHEARRIPEVGQVYAFYGFRFEILKREGTRIAELRIVPPAAI